MWSLHGVLFAALSQAPFTGLEPLERGWRNWEDLNNSVVCGTRFLQHIFSWPGIQKWLSSWYCWLYLSLFLQLKSLLKKIQGVYIYIHITCSHPTNRPESKPWSNALQRSHLRIMIGLDPSHWVCSCKNPVFVGQISILMKQLCYEGRD